MLAIGFFYYLINLDDVLFVEKLKSEDIVNEINGKCPKMNEVNYGASTSGISTSADTKQEASSSNNKQETKPTQSLTKSNNDVNRIPLTPEQLALEQILWVNRMYAVQMAQYWQS